MTLIDTSDNCPICWCTITDPALTSTCRHEFCANCLREWSAQHYRCPTCRRIYGYIMIGAHDPDQLEYVAIGYEGEIDVPETERDLLEEAEDQLRAVSHTLGQLRRCPKTSATRREKNEIKKTIKLLEKLERQYRALVNKRQREKARAVRQANRNIGSTSNSAYVGGSGSGAGVSGGSLLTTGNRSRSTRRHR